MNSSHIRVVEGRLLLADFAGDRIRCRVHPALGEPVECDVDPAQSHLVLKYLLCQVRVEGVIPKMSMSPHPPRLKVTKITGADDHGAVLIGESPDESFGAKGFWGRCSLEQLAADQGVEPLADLSPLLGTWPGEADDGFEDEVTMLRVGDRTA